MSARQPRLNAARGAAFWQRAAVAALFVQLGMLTVWRNALGPYVSPLVLFVASVVPGISLIVLSTGRRQADRQRSAGPDRARQWLAPLAVTAVGAFAIGLMAQRDFDDYPIDVTGAKGSDILPMITIMVGRLVRGEFPYGVITTFGYDLPPTYPPLQWLPFVGAEVLAIDYRWISLASLAAGIFFYENKLFDGAATAATKWFLAALPFVVWGVFLTRDPASFAVTVEPLVAGYYLVLALAILGCSSAPQALALILCLMSRYSLALWIPLYLWILWWRDARRALLVGALVVAGGLVVYGPFLLRDPTIFARAQDNYFTVALHEWNPNWQPPGEKPHHLFQGVGFAVYFYDFLGGELGRRIAILQKVHVAALLSCALFFGAIFLRLRDRIEEASFALGSLGVYLALFYALIQVPYAYLFLVPLFVSCTVVCRAMTLAPPVDAGAWAHRQLASGGERG